MARKVILKAPVPQSLKDRVDQLAAAREESSALIVREALEHYFAKRDLPEIRAVAEDQAPYGQGTGSGLARRESTPTSEPAGDLDDYPAVRAVKQVLAELEAKRAAEQQGPAPRPEPTTGSR